MRKLFAVSIVTVLISLIGLFVLDLIYKSSKEEHIAFHRDDGRSQEKLALKERGDLLFPDIEELWGEERFKNSAYSHSFTHDNQQIYQVVYKVGETGERLGKTTYSNKASTHLILSGDSNIFGQGVSSHQLTSELLQKRDLSRKVLNIAGTGYSPVHTLDLFKKIKYDKGLNTPKGIHLHFFDWYLINRIVGTKSFFRWSKGKAPQYILENNNLRRLGLFKDSTRFNFYQLLDKNSFFYLREFPKITKEHVSLVVALFKGIEKEYLMQFPEGRFILVLAPFSKPRHEGLHKDFYKMIKKAGIEFVKIDLGKSSKNHRFLKRSELFFPHDGHLNEKGHKVLEEAISKILL